ncbi:MULTISPECIES: hypothetical protein [unclassified Sutcliffiella]|uniref:hypothetical protein n=1 Tax=unclassified Sutcliffiella TaxID=2837532 RepID=UPI0030D4E6F2
MEQFISLIVFSLPGLLAYLWIQMFGLNPTVKHNPTEIVGLAALLWAPTTILSVLTYNLLYFIFDNFLGFLKIDISSLTLRYIININDINEMSLSLVFLLYYLMLSGLFSFIVAWVWVTYIYKYMMDLVNWVRVKRKISKLSQETTVWDSFFLKLEENKESPIVIEMYKIDKPEEKQYGSIIRMSRPFETERALILHDSENWKLAYNHFQYSIKRSYVDIKSGIIINELDVPPPQVIESLDN